MVIPDDGKQSAGLGFFFGRLNHPKSILVIVTLACLLPFADKAFHIDDPLFLWASRQMQSKWWDPYGVQVNWYGWEMPLHEVTKNPPMASALIVLISTIAGQNEFTLHVGFFLAAVAVVLGTYALGRRFSRHPMHVALATLFTPVFIISSTTLMCDILMLALWVWAVVVWIRGLDDKHWGFLLAGAFLVAACSLTKYFGIALIPLLLVYSCSRIRKLGSWLMYLLIPILIIAVYEVVTYKLYGHGLVRDAFSYANHVHEAAILFKVFTGLSFVGGCCAIVIFFIPSIWRAGAWGGLIVVLFVFVTIWVLPRSWLASASSLAHFDIRLLWSLFAFCGLVILALPLIEWTRLRDSDSLLLLLWVWGTFVFCILNWTTNGRSILPMLPAVALLLFRRLELVDLPKPIAINTAFVLAAVLSLLVGFADYRLADSGRIAVTKIKAQFASFPATTIWFQGHWGFQYYAQENGFVPFDVNHPLMRSGDLMILPSNNTNLKPNPENTFDRTAIIEVPVLPGIATMNRELGAGFYMDILGPLPFSFGTVPPEKYYILRFK